MFHCFMQFTPWQLKKPHDGGVGGGVLRLRRSTLSPLNRRFRWDVLVKELGFPLIADMLTSMTVTVPGLGIRLKKKPSELQTPQGTP